MIITKKLVADISSADVSSPAARHRCWSSVDDAEPSAVAGSTRGHYAAVHWTFVPVTANISHFLPAHIAPLSGCIKYVQCGLLQSMIPTSVSQSVMRAGCAKRLNGSTSSLEWRLLGPKKHCIRCRFQLPRDDGRGGSMRPLPTYCIHWLLINSTIIKLCPRGAQTCALLLFCDRDLEINCMTLKLEGDLYILKMYLHTENKAVSLRHPKLKAWIEKNVKMSQGQRSKCQSSELLSALS